jgi:hypothetical protein
MHAAWYKNSLPSWLFTSRSLEILSDLISIQIPALVLYYLRVRGGGVPKNIAKN